MSSYKVSVGNAEVISLSDGTNRVMAAKIFPKVSGSQWDKYPGTVSADGNLNTNFGSFIIRSQGQTILIDTGYGPSFPGRLLDELKSKGVPLEEITIVGITHLHPDHVGWNITRGNGQARLTFPNARYWVPKGDWDHYRQPGQLEQSPHMGAVVLPLEELGALELVEGERTLTSEVTMVPTPGHTPGHMSFAIDSQGQHGFILGDVINFPVQAEETGWEIIFDSDAGEARRTREVVLERLESQGAVVGMGHALPPSFGRFVRSEGRRYWQVI